MDSLEYVLYATVCNDFSDEQLAELKALELFIHVSKFYDGDDCV